MGGKLSHDDGGFHQDYESVPKGLVKQVILIDNLFLSSL